MSGTSSRLKSVDKFNAESNKLTFRWQLWVGVETGNAL